MTWPFFWMEKSVNGKRLASRLESRNSIDCAKLILSRALATFPKKSPVVSSSTCSSYSRRYSACLDAKNSQYGISTGVGVGVAPAADDFRRS